DVAGHWIGRPEALLGEALGQRLADGERIPDRLAIEEQHRHLAGDRIALDAARPAGVVELELDLLEGDARFAHQHPRAHRPGGVVLVADEELHARNSSYYRRHALRGPHHAALRRARPPFRAAGRTDARVSLARIPRRESCGARLDARGRQ